MQNRVTLLFLDEYILEFLVPDYYYGPLSGSLRCGFFTDHCCVHYCSAFENELSLSLFIDPEEVSLHFVDSLLGYYWNEISWDLLI